MKHFHWRNTPSEVRNLAADQDPSPNLKPITEAQNSERCRKQVETEEGEADNGL